MGFFKFQNSIDERSEAEYQARKLNMLAAKDKHGGFTGLRKGITLGQYSLMMPDGTPIFCESYDYHSPRIVDAPAWRVSPECLREMAASMEEK